MKTLNIKNFGIINSADIKLGGLTIISGGNDSGKSTVGKLLFTVLKAIQSVENYTEDYREDEVKKLITNIFDEIKVLPSANILGTFFNPPSFLKEIKDYIDNPQNIEKDRDKFNLIFSEKERLLLENNILSPQRKNSILKIKEIVNGEDTDKQFIVKNLIKYLHSEFYSKISPEGKELKTEVHLTINDDDFHFNAKTNEIENESLEYSGACFFDDSTLIESPLFMQLFNLINYADVLAEDNSKYGRPKVHLHIKDLMDKLRNAEYFYKSMPKSSEDLLIKINEIIDGEFFFSPGKESFYFTKKDVGSVEAINTASGIKSFGIFQLLAKTTFINNRNFFIIDEPENHLHPEWQLKYAEIIVELVKRGISIMISSHSPYMIQGLKHFSEKAKIKDKTNFYLAEPTDDNRSDINEVTDDLNKIFSKLAKPLNDLVWL